MSRRVVIVGFGVTGQAVARAVLAAGDEPVVFDDAPGAGAAGAARLGVDVSPVPDGPGLAAALAGADLVVPSPGVPAGHPVLAAAARAGVPVRSEVELAADAASRPGGPRVAAVTGTNGKTTVTTLVTAMLRSSGIAAVAAGNIGVPMIDAAASGADVVVAEVSSFQLHFTDRFHPRVSCWLNFAPDHLDWHPSLDHYAAAKARVWANQGAGDTAVVNADDAAVTAAAEASIPAGVTVVRYSLRQPVDFRVEADRLLGPEGPLVEVARLPRCLPHDLSNSLAAAAVALAAGATAGGCARALEATGPLPHRVSLVGRYGGVSWYDDSKATTPDSVVAAVAGFASVVLIAGGRNKGLDLSPLGATVPPVKAVVAIGEAAAHVAAAFAGRVPVKVASTMEAAVDAARAFAEPGDAVLLSPACASFDWYQSYGARGDHFASIVTGAMQKGDEQC
ncbi:MAG: UDP-N-acetylmuramoyl-L-alanine--D-glutamate ligase [Acidimicrobiales bacterium]